MHHVVKARILRRPLGEDKDRLGRAFLASIDNLKACIAIAKGVAGATGGPPGLQTGLEGLLYVLNAIQVSHRSERTEVSRKHGWTENGSKRDGYRATGGKNPKPRVHPTESSSKPITFPFDRYSDVPTIVVSPFQDTAVHRLTKSSAPIGSGMVKSKCSNR